MTTIEKIRELYVDPGQPGSFSGLNNFSRGLKKVNIKASTKVLEKVLRKVDAYTLHKSVRKRFPRNRVIVPSIDHTWQIDLVDLQKFSRFNTGHRYLVTCIDVLSKYAWAVALKNKEGKTLAKALKDIFKKGRKPKCIQADKGTEFFNDNVRKLLEDNEIKLYAIYSENKACVIERFNRTLKEKMWRYFTGANKHRYIDVLQKLIESYNNSYHRTIGMQPNQVNKTNEKEIWYRLYGNLKNEKIKFKFQVGDYVRIPLLKTTFEKSYTQSWTHEVFTIHERIPRIPPVYRIKDERNEIILGVFYEKELQKAEKIVEYKIEKILATKKINGITYKLVKWLGFDDSFNSWEPASSIRKQK